MSSMQGCGTVWRETRVLSVWGLSSSYRMLTFLLAMRFTPILLSLLALPSGLSDSPTVRLSTQNPTDWLYDCKSPILTTLSSSDASTVTSNLLLTPTPPTESSVTVTTSPTSFAITSLPATPTSIIGATTLSPTTLIYRTGTTYPSLPHTIAALESFSRLPTPCLQLECEDGTPLDPAATQSVLQHLNTCLGKSTVLNHKTVSDMFTGSGGGLSKEEFRRGLGSTSRVMGRSLMAG